MFIYCVDKELKEELIKKGYQLLKEDDNGAVFVFDENIKFNFAEISKNKFMFTNKLTFQGVEYV